MGEKNGGHLAPWMRRHKIQAQSKVFFVPGYRQNSVNFGNKKSVLQSALFTSVFVL